ncbi:N-acetylglucosamine kinase [Sphaerisporangium perillae]|uniref:N-acetylglucosamine kinase n=1 Tax=Sphaerisporangium perillae TaxID=2935860 RepID=UPI00200EFC42|nr:BadF/BadG/BcrA/BcrD ATPase family protein [Sphaerisporangium perillae]
MTGLLAGVDVGGTKTHIRLADPRTGQIIADSTLPSSGWQTRSLTDAAVWLAERVYPLVPAGDRILHMVAGAQGCETEEHCGALARELGATMSAPATVVNDAELLVPAAGLESGIGLVSGTGAVAVGRHRETGRFMSAGGWGWVLGDEGSGSALVRDAARAVLARADEGAGTDELEVALLRSFDVPGLAELAATMSWDSGVETWSAHAPVVFAAAERGSELAATVIRDGGRALARLVVCLVRRGAGGAAVVVAGGVIVNRPRLRELFENELASQLPEMPVTVLRAPPVQGAVELARRAV